jgi:hypothetical protein
VFRRLSLALGAAILLIGIQASAAFGAANDDNASCLALFTSNQGPGEVAESVTGNLAEAHPFGVIVISYTATLKAPCFEED